jgi:hypothetical protein
MAATISNASFTPLPGGQGLLSGFATLSNVYLTGGEVLDLSSYFSSTSYPVVTLNGDDGYTVKHDRGTAAAGKIMAYKPDAATSNSVMTQVANAADLSAVICPFTAMGKVN